MKVSMFLKWLRAFMWVLFCISLGMLGSCRGYFSENPPIDLSPNLDVQPKQKAQSLSRAFPEGVVAQSSEEYIESARVKHGIVIEGDYLPTSNVEAFAEASVSQEPLPFESRYTTRIPYAVNEDFVMRGMERFNIYCAVCHTKAGTGRSIIVGRGVGIPPPPDLSGSIVRSMSDGELFNVITHGRRNMRGYATQIQIEDRWAIVSYIRALQYSRAGSLADVPNRVRESLVKEIQAKQIERIENNASSEAGADSSELSNDEESQ